MNAHEVFELGAPDLRRIDDIVRQRTGLGCADQHAQWRRRRFRAWLIAAAVLLLLAALIQGLYPIFG